jgi:hypothetical protein
MRYITAATVVALTALTACAWKRTPVPVISDSGSSALLVGTWSGEYSSRETGRSGSITFEMASEKDTAYCDVVMVPKVHAFQTVAREQPAAQTMRPESLVQPLKIRFIRLGDGRVSGKLDPYLDPECNCQVNTTFEGTLNGANTIEGTFITSGTAVQTSSGTWKVKRQAPRAGTQ